MDSFSLKFGTQKRTLCPVIVAMQRGVFMSMRTAQWEARLDAVAHDAERLIQLVFPDAKKFRSLWRGFSTVR